MVEQGIEMEMEMDMDMAAFDAMISHMFGYNPPELEEKKLESLGDGIRKIMLGEEEEHPYLRESSVDYYPDNDNDDDADAGDGFRVMTKEEFAEYKKKIEKTNGFDVDVPDEIVGCGVIKPYPAFAESTEVLEAVMQGSILAIKHYNEDFGTNFEFLKVLSLGCEVCCFLDYITFEATQKLPGGGSELHEIFQAIVYAGVVLTDLKVKFCRIKPKSY